MTKLNPLVFYGLCTDGDAPVLRLWRGKKKIDVPLTAAQVVDLVRSSASVAARMIDSLYGEVVNLRARKDGAQ